jgi:CubicO group peptidase (beta-lactamase class C family)
MPDAPAGAFDRATTLLDEAIRARAMPAAVAEAGRRTGRVWTTALGTLTYDAGARPTTLDTVFDLASLTKVIATTTITMRAIQSGALRLDTRVADVLSTWRGADREAVTIRHLLDHSSGLPAHRRLWEQARGRDAFEHLIAATPLESKPGTAAVYSDLGFMLLGFVLADVCGNPLDALWDQWRRVSLPRDAPITYGTASTAGPIAPTEHDPWRGHVLRGEVHDENAAALGGVAAHAGLFGAARGVGAFARLVLQTFRSPTPLGDPDLMRTFAAPSRPGASRALGWDTMRPTSSCGTRMAPTAIGHTGFTGTSLWIDHERDVYVVLLTNRVHPTRENQALPALRPAFHDAVMDALIADPAIGPDGARD